jgi:hypothetical protein
MFGRRRREPPASGQGAELRMMVLGLDPDELGLSPAGGRRVWGFVMDTGLDHDGWHCLAVLDEGTTSLYTSGAFGIIGGGAHPTVREASERLLAAVELALALFVPSTDYATPGEGLVTMRALTFDGQLVVTAPEDQLGDERHLASSVFHTAHEVITELRLLTEPLG